MQINGLVSKDYIVVKDGKVILQSDSREWATKGTAWVSGVEIFKFNGTVWVKVEPWKYVRRTGKSKAMVGGAR